MTSDCVTVVMCAKSITTMLGPREHLFNNYSLSMGMSNAIMAEGMCGAPIVRVPYHDGEGGGGVLGFFHLGYNDSTWAAIESIDNLINDVWKSSSKGCFSVPLSIANRPRFGCYSQVRILVHSYARIVQVGRT